jgi:hypothetical protein
MSNAYSIRDAAQAPLGHASDSPKPDRAYVVSVNEWNGDMVKQGLVQAKWLTESGESPDDEFTLLVLVDDPLTCPPSGLMNLQAVKKQIIVSDATVFARNLTCLELVVLHPQHVSAHLGLVSRVRFHASQPR